MREGAGNDRLKRRVRNLKKLERIIRFESTGGTDNRKSLVWDEFFDLRDSPVGRARYSLAALAAMDREAYREIVADFFFCVYTRLYQENGILCRGLYDPQLLHNLGLPPDADSAAVKKRFRQLALRTHPDTGGDAAQFIELMDNYRKLTDTRQ